MSPESETESVRCATCIEVKTGKKRYLHIDGDVSRGETLFVSRPFPGPSGCGIESGEAPAIPFVKCVGLTLGLDVGYVPFPTVVSQPSYSPPSSCARSNNSKVISSIDFQSTRSVRSSVTP